jgi:hypothetical protein
MLYFFRSVLKKLEVANVRTWVLPRVEKSLPNLGQEPARLNPKSKGEFKKK